MTEQAPLRVLIVDDEPRARSGIRKLLEPDADIQVVEECGDGPTAVAAISTLEPDIVLLDVQMPGMNGFEVVRAVGVENMPLVIFVTAYDQFALDAFDVNAVDYLLKPFDDDRFVTAIARAKTNLRARELDNLSRRLIGLLERTTGGASAPKLAASASSADERSSFLTRLVVKNAGRVSFVPTDEIDWIEAADYYSKLHVSDEVHLLRETMQSLEARLDPNRFFRVHRSAIVNLDRVKELQPYFGRSHVVILRDGTKLKLSRARREKLATLLDQGL